MIKLAAMMRALQLFLPVLFPSWRFFPEVGPSPRIEYALLSGPDDAAPTWMAFAPPPAALSFAQSLKSLFWNPARNASLFLVTCSEQFIGNDAQPALEHLTDYVRDGALRQNPTTTHEYFQFRLIAVFREEDEITRTEVYRSSVLPLKPVDTL